MDYLSDVRSQERFFGDRQDSKTVGFWMIRQRLRLGVVFFFFPSFSLSLSTGAYLYILALKIIFRSGQLLNLRAEKVTEISVDEAVHHVVDNLPGAKLVDWTSAESTLLPENADNGKYCQSCGRVVCKSIESVQLVIPFQHPKWRDI